jgi:hypothetical protein
MRSLLFALFTLTLALPSQAQQEPWKKEQVMPTATLAARIQSGKEIPVILNVGPMDNIKTALRVGATNTDEGIAKLKTTVAGLDKNKEVVIYCGCCTYSNCPNIRPAFKAMEDWGFKKVRVLNIPEGIKPDWSGKGYPME